MQAERKFPLILVVEDDEDNLILISHALIFFKYTFITANNAQTALELAKNHQLDLIIVDIVLRDRNGLELVHDLKHGKSTKNLPIIAVTALARKEDQNLLLAAGCNDYLCKPYLIDELNEKIRYNLPPQFFHPGALRVA
ncbi:response regulator receiver protein [Stanieria cyanosphaera PCC 7437]|uniref:Response regulator receiver protein n=1 Tax=Stanieria cyanosphaera (strain ATCC 29371 / PCC 7437) TaxID=111780 RepID=K9XWJ5_STAC7|nr:response regulator [Stanieria cyanosphaera]AFZ36444.1 response regulator receiver protein [Stanieria cyanosphaera PCC 7437]